MPYNAITDAEIASGKPIPTTLMAKVQANDAYFYGLSGSQTSSLGIINGSFEIDSDADGVPDSWTRNLYPGGTGSLYTTAPAHGAQSWSFVHPGGVSNGGGYLDSDYFEVSPQILYLVRFILWATAAGMKNMVQIRYYDKDQAELESGSPETIFTTTTNPASATPYIVQFNPPATTCYARVRLIGGYTDTDVAGTAYFDDVGLAVAQAGSAAAPASHAIGGVAYAKFKEIVVSRSGDYFTSFFMSHENTGGGGEAYGKIYVNGSPVGAEHMVTAPEGQIRNGVFMDLLPGLIVGDAVQLYGYGVGSPIVRNLLIMEKGLHTVVTD